KADEVAEILAQPPLRLAPGVVEAVAERVLSLIPRLRIALEQRCNVEKRLKNAIDALRAPPAEDPAGQQNEHRDAAIILSWPGIGIRIAATMLAEASKPLTARDYHGLRLLAGCAPVTKQSGKKRVARDSPNSKCKQPKPTSRAEVIFEVRRAGRQ